METLAFATVLSPEGETEAEPVLVDVDGDTICLALDDGTTLAFDRAELLAALGLSASPSTAP
jgi:hypothetical protein